MKLNMMLMAISIGVFILFAGLIFFFQKMSSVFVRNSDSEFRSSILSSDDDTTDSRLSNPKTEEKTVS